MKNIGIHIGGGPNDAPTKAPIRASVSPHFDALGACFGQLPAEAREKAVDVSTDVLVPRAGGKAELKKLKIIAKGSTDSFSACVRRVFDAIEWQKPKGGDTMVSYSLRFTPR